MDIQIGRTYTRTNRDGTTTTRTPYRVTEGHVWYTDHAGPRVVTLARFLRWMRRAS